MSGTVNDYLEMENKVVKLLARAIPQDELVALNERRKASGRVSAFYEENGGYVYNELMTDPASAVASWNNSRKSEEEIIEWFERALLLA